MTSLTQDEYDQLMQLKRLCEYIANNPYPAVDIVNIKALMRSTLGYEDTETNEEEQEQEPANEEESTSRISKPKLKFSHMINLIGKDAHNNQAILTRKYKGNPYNIPIDRYVKCEACGKVAISGITISGKNDVTYVYQRFRHEQGSSNHYLRFDRFEGNLTWEDILEHKKEEGIKAEAV